MSSPLIKTPESLTAGLRRKDSKNALTTCHGVTDKGRACRRPIAGSKAAYGLSGASNSGAIVIPQTAEDPAVFFCWQHKDQAELLNFAGSEIVEVNDRTSLEDAFSKLGLEEVSEEDEESSKEPTPIPSPRKRVSYDATPRLPSPERFVGSSEQAPTKGDARPSYQRRHSSDYDRHRRRDSRYYSQRKPNYMSTKRELGGFWSALLGGCFNDDESVEPKRRERHTRGEPEDRHYRREGSTRHSRHSAPPEVRQKPVGTPTKTSQGVGPGNHSVATPASIRQERHERPRRVSDNIIEQQYARRDSTFDNSAPITPGDRRPKVFRDSPSGPSGSTGALLAPPSDTRSRPVLAERRPANGWSKSSPGPQAVGEWIPEPPIILNPAERDTKLNCYARLLTEMSKGPTPKDAHGYIYIFWQTDVEQTDAETAAAASLISAPTDRPQRSEEEILARRFFQTSANARLPPREKRTIFLKIGRAVNVHQRLNQWQKQCQYNISLLRSYPFATDGRAARMVPFVGKVESLIHLDLEMLGKRVKRQCRCGTEHREWFEFDATPRAIREADALVQKWIKWSQEKKDWAMRTPV